MKQYLILLYGGLHIEDMTTEQKKAHFIKWGQYLAYFSQNDQLISGSPLHKAGKLLTQNGLFDLQDHNQLEGFMLLKAESFEAVEQLLEQCPSLEYNNNKIEIRELNPGLH